MENGIRVVAWNVAHQIRDCPIPDSMREAISLLSPDVLVLAEYVPGRDHDRFVNELKSLRFGTPLLSERVARQNQVLIACRTACEAGTTRAPDVFPQSRPNLLDVRLTGYGLRILGLRIPMFRRHERAEERLYWEWLLGNAREWASEASLIMSRNGCAADQRSIPRRQPLTVRHVAMLAIVEPVFTI